MKPACPGSAPVGWRVLHPVLVDWHGIAVLGPQMCATDGDLPQPRMVAPVPKLTVLREEAGGRETRVVQVYLGI